MRKKGVVITIDGPAGAGKSTTARQVACRLRYLYLDTGAMYRAVGVGALRAGVDLDDTEAVGRLARTLTIELRSNGNQQTILNGEDISRAIRTSEASDAASRVAVHPPIRDILVARQQEMGRDGGIVLEGRDTGSVIFPDAELKIFLVAHVEERAKRRLKELTRRGEAAAFETLVNQIRERDGRDRATQERFGPWPPPDAVLVDTTGLTIAEQVDRVVAMAMDRGVVVP